MKYSEELSNEEYIDNFKCCRNCPHWDRDITLEGDYAYNTCHYWAEKGEKWFACLIPWQVFCEGYAGTKTNEGPYHKMIMRDGQLVFEKRRSRHENSEV